MMKKGMTTMIAASMEGHPLTTLTVSMPDALNPLTRRSVVEFAQAMAKKMREAEIKYGYSGGWTDPNWEAKCRAELWDHIVKGDPRDVAIYAMFMWYHGWSTAKPS